MRGTDKTTFRPHASPEAQHSRKPLFVGTLLLAILLAGALFTLLAPKPVAPPPGPAATPAVEEVRTSSVPNLAVARPKAAAPMAAPPAVAPGPRPARELMAELAELSAGAGPLTKEQAEQFKRDLAALVEAGPASVPAIAGFLEKNADVDYSQLSGGDQLGYSSFRASLFDALKQIGGPEAQAAMLKALQTTALPTEMLELAKNLDQESPSAFRDQILSAAQAALAMDASGQLGTNREVGPAFHMLQTYGSANTMEEVAKTDPVNFYNALNLASLPDGQGLQGLVQMVQNTTGGSQAVATEMIAQLAGQNSQALETLLQMAQKGQLSNGAWMRLAPILGGDQYQIDSSGAQGGTGGTEGAGNLNYSVVNSATTPDDINQRIALLQRCLGVVPADSAAANALRRQLDVLTAKLRN